MKAEAVPPSEQDEKHHDDHDEHDPNLKEFSNVQMKSIVLRGWICLFGGVCMHLVLGTFYLWGGISSHSLFHLLIQF